MQVRRGIEQGATEGYRRENSRLIAPESRHTMLHKSACIPRIPRITRTAAKRKVTLVRAQIDHRAEVLHELEELSARRRVLQCLELLNAHTPMLIIVYGCDQAQTTLVSKLRRSHNQDSVFYLANLSRLNGRIYTLILYLHTNLVCFRNKRPDSNVNHSVRL